MAKLLGPRFGTLLSLVGTAITTSYVAGSDYLACGGWARVRFYFTIVGKSGTAISPAKLKVQACAPDDDPTVSGNWYDIATTNEAGETTSQPLKEHSVTVGSATTVKGSIVADGTLGYLRIAGLGAGAGASGDSITVVARAAGQR